MEPSLTVIGKGAMRGLVVLGVSKRELENVVDFIELSSSASQRETRERIREADRTKSWIPLKKAHAEARKSL